MTLRIPVKVLLHVCSYDFYDMTLSTGKQRRHMINDVMHWKTATSYDNVHQAYTKRTKLASNVSPMCSWRMLNFTFLSTRPARVWLMYTLMCDYCLK